jgi:hypothetical protein
VSLRKDRCVRAVLPALTIYSPEHNSRAKLQAGRVLAVWNPSRRQVLSYVALACCVTILLFAVVFLLINNYEPQACLFQRSHDCNRRVRCL